jgi:hypothetical protein
MQHQLVTHKFDPFLTVVKKRASRAAERSIKVNSAIHLYCFSIGVFHFNLPLCFRNFSSSLNSESAEYTSEGLAPKRKSLSSLELTASEAGHRLALNEGQKENK